MNKLQKLKALKTSKINENGDISFSSTGSKLIDLYFMADYFANHLDEVQIGTSEKEQLFSMYMRDPRFGQGRKDLGRTLMELSQVNSENIVLAGRYDDLWRIPTDENLQYLYNSVIEGNNLAKKWLPRLTSANKDAAKALASTWKLSEKEYRALIKAEDTVEHKLSYHENENKNLNPLEEVFKVKNITHPLVETIDFEKVPTLAMAKYLGTFSRREDLSERFSAYMNDVKANKAKINVATADVTIARKIATSNARGLFEDNSEIFAQKIIENETIGLSLDAIVVLDTSASMKFSYEHSQTPYDKAMALAHSISLNSTYAKGQLISFSKNPKLMTIKGNTLREQYASMHTGDISNTNFAAVLELLKGLTKFPKYLIVLSDMEFDSGSYQSKEELYRLFKQIGAETKLVWWNLNGRNKTTPEMDEYGNFYLSGQNLQVLNLLTSVKEQEEFLDRLLLDYSKKVFN